MRGVEGIVVVKIGGGGDTTVVVLIVPGKQCLLCGRATKTSVGTTFMFTRSRAWTSDRFVFASTEDNGTCAASVPAMARVDVGAPPAAGLIQGGETLGCCWGAERGRGNGWLTKHG